MCWTPTECTTWSFLYPHIFTLFILLFILTLTSRALKLSMRWERRLLSFPTHIDHQSVNELHMDSQTDSIDHSNTHTRTFTRSRIKENSSALLQPVTVCKVAVILCVKWWQGKIHCQGKKGVSSRPTLGKLIFWKSKKWKLDIVASLSSSH